jgi:uncharacterized membrane protein
MLISVSIFYVVTRSYHLNYFALWNDEVFSVTVAKMPWPGMFRAVADDIVHPPLFYILLKSWIYVGGSSVIWMRLLPFLISVATLVPLLLLFREWNLSPLEMTLAMVLISFNELLIYYSQELRMYSLLAGLSLTSLWLFGRFVHGIGGVFWLAATNFLLAYSHYYGVLFVCTEVLYLLWWSNREKNWTTMFRFLVPTIGIGLAYLPWLYLVGRALRKHGLSEKLSVLERPRFRDVLWFYESLKGQPPIRHTALLGLLLFLILLIPVLVALVYRPERRDLTVLLTLFGFFPPAVSIAASYLMQQSVFGARYLITAVVPCLLLVAMGIAGMSARPKRVIGSLLLTWAVLSGVWFTLLPNRKVPWDTLAHYLAASKSLVYTYERHEQTPLQYYGVSTNLIDKREVEHIKDRDFYLVYRPDTVGSELQNLESHGYGVMDKYIVHGNEEIIAVHLRRQ